MSAVQDRLRAARQKPANTAPVTWQTVAAPAGDTRNYGAAALAGECDAVANTSEGGRNARLNIAAVKVASVVAGGHLDADTAKAALTAAARQAGLDDHEIGATIASGFRHGAQTPRVKPELTDPDKEINAWLNTSSTAPTSSPAYPPDTNGSAADPGGPQPDDADEADLVREHLPLLDWHELWTREADEEWIVEPLLPARRLIALYSAPKVGKSLLMLELAAGIARGVSVLGAKAGRPRRVLYVDYENDPVGDLRSRLINMGLTPDDLANLCYLSFPTMATLDTPQGAAQLLAAVRTYECEVVVVDTVSRAVAGDENENDTWLKFYRETGLALKQAGVALIRLDHAGKDETKGQRGGSAKVGDVDAVWRMTKRSDGVYQLICEAHRFPLPVADELLTITREDDPLRHRVDAMGAGHLLRDQASDWLTANTGWNLSYRAAYASLHEAGITIGEKALRALLATRQVEPS